MKMHTIHKSYQFLVYLTLAMAVADIARAANGADDAQRGSIQGSGRSNGADDNQDDNSQRSGSSHGEDDAQGAAFKEANG